MTEENAIKLQVQETFKKTDDFDSLMLLLETELDYYNIGFGRLGGVVLTPMVVIDNHNPHKFTTMGDAFKFALEEYKKAVQLEVAIEAVNNITNVLEEATKA